MKIPALILAVGLSTVASTACTPGRAAAPSIVEPGEPAMGHGLKVSVENRRPATMLIFATRENMKFLVGEVGPWQTARFAMPQMILEGRGELRLIADPRGSTLEQRSEPIVLTGGRELQWRLRPGGGDRVWVR